MPDTPSEPEVHTVGIFITYSSDEPLPSLQWSVWAEKVLEFAPQAGLDIKTIVSAHLPKGEPSGPASSTSD